MAATVSVMYPPPFLYDHPGTPFDPLLGSSTILGPQHHVEMNSRYSKFFGHQQCSLLILAVLVRREVLAFVAIKSHKSGSVDSSHHFNPPLEQLSVRYSVATAQ